MRALLSPWYKTGLDAFASGLVSLGWEVVASGNTSRFLTEHGIAHATVESVTGSPEMLGGRVKTLHPRIHGGILADRSKPEHLGAMETHGIEGIDLVVVNLYPFSKTVADPDVDPAEAIEMIDIGGPTMVRAAAKNHEHVTIVVDPGDYGAVLDEVRREGGTTLATRRRLARKAFAHVAAYDAAIVTWFDDADGETLPDTIHVALERAQELRYGENPHQAGARYRETGQRSLWDDAVQHQGLALSYLNLYDAEAAWRIVFDIARDGRPAVVIVKHANPSGAAIHDHQVEAYQRALACDEQSAFGGIVAVDRPLSLAMAEAMKDGPQADVVIAPGYEDGAIDVLRAKRKNTRVLEAAPPEALRIDLRQISGGFLVQRPHHFAAGRDDWRVVTKVAPTEAQWRDAELAWRVCGHVKSNSIVLVKDEVAWGIGAGQQKRVDSGEIAARKAGGRAQGGACASDAFYPFPDGVEAAIAAGAAVVIQPGGGLHDDEIIKTADDAGIAMVLTGERHFLH